QGFLDTFVHGSASGLVVAGIRQLRPSSQFAPLWEVIRLGGINRTRYRSTGSCYPHLRQDRVGWPSAPIADLDTAPHRLLRLDWPSGPARGTLAPLRSTRGQAGLAGVDQGEGTRPVPQDR